MGFRWRRRNEGFEWRTYVRTTILLKREKRRKKADDLKAAAVFGIKQAGQKGVDAAQGGMKSVERRGKRMVEKAGLRVRRRLHAAKESAVAVGHSAFQLSSAAAVAGGHAVADKVKNAQGSVADKVRFAQGSVADKVKQAQGSVAEKARHAQGSVASGAASAASSAKQSAKNSASGLAQLCARLAGRTRRLTAAGTLLLSALGVAAYRAWTLNFKPNAYEDPAVAALLAIAAACLAYIAIARWFLNRDTGPVTLAKGAAVAAGAAASSAARRRVEVPLPALGLGIAALAAMAFWRPPVSWPALSFSSLSTIAQFVSAKPVIISGSATVLSAATLRVGDVKIQLDGIEAPASSQTCQSNRGRSINCAEEAKSALASAVRKKQVTCTVTGHDADGFPIARCTADGRDFAASLVRAGRVFATGGLLSLYGSQESEAKTLRAGLWQSDTPRPAEWREARWQDAVRKAPAGCPIKGKVLSKTSKVYVLPWARRYDDARVDEKRGERWFCSEAEAQTAGWRKG